MSEAIDCVVVGAGVVGLAVARAQALAGREVLVLEQAEQIGTQTSSRNSEVIHAGIYYPKGSLKAKLCVRGKELLYDYCAARGVPHARCGKLIVATSEQQRAILEGYVSQAQANGVDGPAALQWLSRDDARRLEPAVAAHCGLLSPSTGIIDSHSYMLALQGDLENAGGLVVCHTRVRALNVERGRIRVTTDEMDLEVNTLINCAGLNAVDLARQLTQETPSAYYSIGHYYTYSGRSPFKRLVYPVAEAGGLGVHVTLDLAGGVKFGPDVRWLDDVDYQFDDSQRQAFEQAILAYFPGLDSTKLQPGYTGIRPKISGPQTPAADFRIDDVKVHGVNGLINLFGIESPGLTASLAIAEAVSQLSCDQC